MAIKRFFASAPDAQVRGELCLTFLAAITHDEIMPILKQHHFDQFEPHLWYPQQPILDLFRSIAAAPDGPKNLVAIGVKAVDYAVMPPEMNSIAVGLPLMNIAYHLNHANVAASEGYEINLVKPGRIRIVAQMPYPDDLIYGTLWGIICRLRTPGERFSLNIIENPNRPKDGDSPLELVVEWRSITTPEK